MEKRYNIVLADPPWSYRDKCTAGERGAVYKYQTMELDKVKELPVCQLAADNCVLFLWATMPMLPEALSVVKAWGFTYKTIGFGWVKTNKKETSTLAWGMGNWSRSNLEVCLLGIKGKPKRASAGVHSVVIRPRMEHSRKPPEVRDRIVQLCGDLPRIELFARDRGLGWDVWGDEIDSDIALIGIDDNGKAESWRSAKTNDQRGANVDAL